MSDLGMLLHSAAEHEDVDLMRVLLDAGVDVDSTAPDMDGMSVLQHVLDSEFDSHVQTGAPLRVTGSAYLVARGADLYMKTPYGSASSFLRKHNHWLAQAFVDTWEWLPRQHIRERPIPPRSGPWVHRRFSLPEALDRNDSELLRVLIDEGGDVHAQDLLSHCVKAELARAERTGEPLRADLTIQLLIRGAEPASAAQAALEGGHWIATTLFEAWEKQAQKKV